MPKFKVISFMKINPDKWSEILTLLSKIPQVKKCYPMSGKYNVIVELEFKNDNNIYPVWVKVVKKMKWMEYADTHVVIKETEF